MPLDTVEALERLQKLKDSGTLSQEEFESEKKKVMAGNQSPASVIKKKDPPKERRWYERKTVLVILGLIAAVVIASDPPSPDSSTQTFEATPQAIARAQKLEQVKAELAKFTIIGSKLYDENGYPVVSINFQNNTGHPVDALIVRVSFTDNYGDTVYEKHSIEKERYYYGEAQLERALKVGAKYDAEWQPFLFSRATKIDSLEVFSLHYSDTNETVTRVGI